MKKINTSIILASNSPRRKKLLEQINLTFDVIPSNIHEDLDLDLYLLSFFIFFDAISGS